jgi:MobA/MobL family
MAIYRLEAKIIGRQARDKDNKVIPGQQVSMLAKCAYRSGERLRDLRIDQIFDYRSRAQEVVHRDILAREDSPSWLHEEDSPEKRERLWNELERAEKRKDSQLAREFILALPVELSRETHIETVRNWCLENFVAEGFVVDFALHRSYNGENPHAHVLVTFRPMEADGFGLKPSTAGKFNGWGNVGKGAKGELYEWRESWAAAENRALEAAGLDVRVDHRSLFAQGIDRKPEPKIGVAAVHMQREGKLVDPDRVRTARRVRLWNTVVSSIRNVEGSGFVRQEGLGDSWWGRAGMGARLLYDKAVDFMQDESSGGAGIKWRAYVEARGGPEGGPEPGLSR